MCVYKNHAFIFRGRPPKWSGTVQTTGPFNRYRQHHSTTLHSNTLCTLCTLSYSTQVSYALPMAFVLLMGSCTSLEVLLLVLNFCSCSQFPRSYFGAAPVCIVLVGALQELRLHSGSWLGGGGGAAKGLHMEAAGVGLSGGGALEI